MIRLYELLSWIKLAFLYTVKRDEWANHLCSLLSSSNIGVAQKNVVLQHLIHEQFLSEKNYDSGTVDKSSDQRIVQILELLKQISYHETQATEISVASIKKLCEVYKRTTDIDFRPLHTVINRILTDQFSPNIISERGFAQEGEDLILTRLVSQKAGFFIDVGAHHPTRFSNTYKLYLSGWRGINIDPLPGSMQLFDEVRPEDTNLELAISSGNADSTARYYVFDEPAYNSLEAENIADAEAGGKNLIEEIEVKCASFSSILEKYRSSFTHIDLLTIDVEHHELNVLQSFPFDKYQPTIIVIEIKGLNLEQPGNNSIYDYVTGNGYTLRSYLYHSAIFVRA